MQYDVPSTWIDATDDVVPKPRMGLRPPTAQEMREAEMAFTPMVEHPDRRGGRPLDFKPHWVGGYRSECDWLLAMLKKYRTCKQVAKILGCSVWPIKTRAKNYGITVVVGKGYVG